MENIVCSFCGTSFPHEEAKDRLVAGPEAFICRDCVEMTIDIFGTPNLEWRNRMIKLLSAMPKN